MTDEIEYSTIPGPLLPVYLDGCANHYPGTNHVWDKYDSKVARSTARRIRELEAEVARLLAGEPT